MRCGFSLPIKEGKSDPVLLETAAMNRLPLKPAIVRSQSLQLEVVRRFSFINDVQIRTPLSRAADLGHLYHYAER